MSNYHSRYEMLRAQAKLQAALTNTQNGSIDYNTQNLLAMMDALYGMLNDRSVWVQVDAKSAKKATADLMAIFNKSIK